MPHKLLENKKTERLFAFVAWLIVLAGCITRLVVYLQNRNLFIDEANVARNLYERSFAGLALPLSHEQYAPPIFLWIEKTATLCNGFGELTLRAFPFFTGVVSFIVFTQILKIITSYRSLWYPLYILASGFIYVQYSTELKQYMPDVLVTLSLILLTLNTDITKVRRGKFIVTWLIAGSIGIWSCMPSAFVLCGVGTYYMYQCRKQKELLPTVIITGIAWTLQFLFYYIVILRPQANSAYLQNFHHDFFLFAVPDTIGKLQHNVNLCKDIFKTAMGYYDLANIFNGIALMIGCIWLIRKRTAIALLIIVPLIAMLVAAAFHQYSLISRVTLFAMPLILILAGCGLEQMLSTRYLAISLIAGYFAFVACKAQSSLTEVMNNPMKKEQVTDGLTFLQKHQITGSELLIHTGAGPAYVYYTTINPAKGQWSQLANGYIMPYQAATDSIADHTTGPLALLMAHGNDDEIKATKNKLAARMELTDSFMATGCTVFIYNRK